ncbi:MAG: transglycosylase SLT domain-containing protein [Terracidiphilus sp.]
MPAERRFRQEEFMPTTQEIRDHLTSLANSYGVPTALVLAVARTETANFDVNAVVPNLNTSGELLSTDYGLMQINDKTWIGNTLPGPDGQPFTITDSVKNDWTANANAGVALIADEYRKASDYQADKGGTAQTIAQQTYSAYNAGGALNENHALRYTKTGANADPRDQNFLAAYNTEQALAPAPAPATDQANTPPICDQPAPAPVTSGPVCDQPITDSATSGPTSEQPASGPTSDQPATDSTATPAISEQPTPDQATAGPTSDQPTPDSAATPPICDPPPTDSESTPPISDQPTIDSAATNQAISDQLQQAAQQAALQAQQQQDQMQRQVQQDNERQEEDNERQVQENDERQQEDDERQLQEDDERQQQEDDEREEQENDERQEQQDMMESNRIA